MLASAISRDAYDPPTHRGGVKARLKKLCKISTTHFTGPRCLVLPLATCCFKPAPPKLPERALQVLPTNYLSEFLRVPYFTITALTLGAYWAHPLMQQVRAVPSAPPNPAASCAASLQALWLFPALLQASYSLGW